MGFNMNTNEPVVFLELRRELSAAPGITYAMDVNEAKGIVNSIVDAISDAERYATEPEFAAKVRAMGEAQVTQQARGAIGGAAFRGESACAKLPLSPMIGASFNRKGRVLN